MCRNLCKACRLVRTWKLHSTSICSGSTWTPATNTTCPTNCRDVLNSLLFFMFTEASTLALVENSLDIIEILFQLGDNYDVIQRIQSWWHLSIPLVLSHEPLKCCKSILQSKQHDFELEQTKRAKKRLWFLTPQGPFPSASTKDSSTWETIQYLLDCGNGVCICDCVFIHFSEIHTEPWFAHFPGNQDYWRSASRTRGSMRSSFSMLSMSSYPVLLIGSDLVRKIWCFYRSEHPTLLYRHQQCWLKRSLIGVSCVPPDETFG